jgi:very-short-patch-repair endonuclease
MADAGGPRADVDELDINNCGQAHPRDLAIAEHADRQAGVVSRRQLIALGLTIREIEHRVTVGRLHVSHRGVYIVGRRGLDQRGRWIAAVFALGPGAALSHREAAILHELRGATTIREVNVTVPGRGRRNRTGIRVHSVRHLHPDDVTEVDGIPVTSLARTLLDYAETAHPSAFEYAFKAYDRSDRLDTRELDAVIARNPGRRGIKALRRTLANYRADPELKSRNERALYSAIRRAGLPVPQTNVVVEGISVDMWWPRQRLVIEVDGYHWHHTPADRAEDRRKQRVLRAAGIEVARLTDEEIKDEPTAIGEVRAGLQRASRRAVAVSNGG